MLYYSAYHHCALTLRMMVFQYPENLCSYFIHRTIAIHRNQASGSAIILRHWRSLYLIGGQPRLNHFQPVVVADFQLFPIDIAKLIDGWLLKVDVVDPPTGGTRTSSSNAEQQLIIIHLKADHNWPRPRGPRVIKELVIEQRIQPSGLCRGARKTIQYITALAIRLLQTLANHLADQVVGNQLAPVHDRLGGHAQFRSLGHVVPQ